MNWIKRTGVVYTFILLLYLICVKGIEVFANFKTFSNASTGNQIFSANLGDGWTYQIDRNSDVPGSVDKIISIDATGGIVYSHNDDVCRYIQPSPLEVQILGNCHNKNAHIFYFNYTVLSLDIYFENLPCSVPLHRKNYVNTLKKPIDIHIIIFSSTIAKGNTMYCAERGVTLLQLKHYIPVSLHKMICGVLVEDLNIYYNYTDSTLSTTDVICFFKSTLSIPLTVKLCPLDNGAQLHILVHIHSLQDTSDMFRIYRQSEKQLRLKRQLTGSSPSFTKSLYNVSVMENLAAGYNVTMVTAIDADPGEAGKLIYQLQSKNDERSMEMFTIDSISGLVTTTKSLDRETMSRHEFLVTATDSSPYKKSASASLIVTVLDENDNPPKFDQNVYKINQTENVQVLFAVITVIATDRDIGENADIRYSIIVPPNSLTFKIDPKSGDITAVNVFDREVVANYTLVVQAIDQAPPGKQRSSTATIEIKVLDDNDNIPQFDHDSYNVNVSEDIDISGSPVICKITATDADEGLNALLHYSITSGNIESNFYIDPNTGVVSVKKPLDYETKQMFRMTVKASDSGSVAKTNSTTLLVQIIDVNDNKPYFQNPTYSGSVPENVPVGTSVLSVNALDKDSGINALLEYSINNISSAFPFSINASTGRINVQAQIDRELKSSYSFTVQVEDKGVPSLSSTCLVDVTIRDVNDNSPVFSQNIFYVTIAENIQLHTSIITVNATDADENELLKYVIVSGNNNQIYAIDVTSGAITLITKLEYKIQNQYILEIQVMDKANHSAKAEVHINVTDINKYCPTFDGASYQLKIDEGMAIGSSVGKVSATDGDVGENGRITYELVNKLPELNIDPNTGAITTDKILDRELQASYTFQVKASDNGQPNCSNTADVMITVNDINDNVPVFDKTTYQASVSEAAIVGYLVLTVHAIDNDTGVNAQIRYMYANGSDGIRDFEIGSSNGEIRVAKNHNIDREKQNNYTLYILAVDGGIQPLSGSTQVKVKIEDVNDNAPAFPEDKIFAQIPENTKIGSTVAVITAVDPDEGINAVVEYSFELGLDADKFVLNNQPGGPAIIVSHVDFDYESGKTEFYIRLKASSGTLFSIALILIQIQDVNDNSPILQDFNIIFNNFENLFPSDSIGHIPAFDPDVSDRQKLSYKFQLGNEAGFLLLNESSGEITLDSRLNSDVPRNATIQVQVSDGLHEVRATCHLQVRLVTNDMLQNSVTIRINNMTSNVFLSPLFTFFVDALATIIKTNKNNIFVISVRNDTDVNAEILNVTVSVQQKSDLVDGDQFYSAEFLMEQIYLQRTLLANLSTLQILPFDDNLCLMEVCSNFEKCLSGLQLGEAAKFITSDTMLFRPIHPINGYRCACPAGFTGSDTFHYCDTEVNLCYSSPCNGSGICHSTEGGYTCTCKDGFTGPNCEINVAGKYNQMSCPVDACNLPSHCVPVIEGGFRCEGCPNSEYTNQFCQLTTRSFPKGSFLMYPTIKSRYRFTIQMKFATQQRDGLLFYNGRFNELHDFIALEIIDTQLQFSFSTGTDIFKVSPYIKGGLNDGKWHQVTVDYNNMTATVSVGEDCETEISVKFGQNINYTCAARASLTPNCSKEGNIYNCQMLLDLTGPLQIGGLPTLPSNFQVQNKDFVGCIQDFYVDNRLLDFNKSVADNGTVIGCLDKQNFCLVAPCQHGGTCMEGWSTYLCSCPERWAGKDCSQEIDVSQKLSGTGYLTYSTATIPQVQFPWFNGISFRTRKKRGTLMYIVAGGLESITIKLVDGYVVYSYNNSQMLQQEFNFHSVAVDDGQWHFFETQWMDNGDVIMTIDYGQRQTQMHIQNNTMSQKAIKQVYVGVKNINLNAAVDYFIGCVRNVRLGNTRNSILLNPTVYNATEGCDSSNSCTSGPCSAHAECVNNWEGYTCKCPLGTMGGQCDNICTNYNPCQNMANCHYQQGQGYYCKCGQLQSGKYCEIVAKQPCPSKWWGYPVCGPCHENCSLENGFDPNCDKQTGKCSCKDYFYQPLGSYKCLPCNCYGYGSKSLQCDPLTGQCTCVDGVIGTRCDQCASKYAEIRLDELTNVYGCKVVADYGNCPHVFSHGMWWDTGVAGEMLIQKCPNKAVGEAKRNCSTDCLWQEPDFFNCTNLLFIDQQMDNLISGGLKITTFVAKKMVATLANAVSNTETLYGNDINITMQILYKILNYENLQSGLNLTSEQDNRYLFNMFSVLSNILQTKYTTEWTRFNQEGLGTVQLLDQLETYLSTLLSALELTSMQSPRPYNIISNSIVLGVDYIKKNNFSGINIPKFDNIVKNPMYDEETNLFLPQSILSDPPVQDVLQPDLSVMPTAYVGYIMFKNLGDLLPKKYATNVRVVSERPISVNSLVFTIILNDAGINVTGPLADPIEIKFKQLLSENRTSPQCVAWDEASSYAGEWSTAGCVQLDHYTQEDKVYITCSCSHMTSFAVLMDISDHEYLPAVPVSIGVITYIGLILCMACLVLCFVILVSLKRVHSNTSSIHVNLVFVIFVAQLAFVLGINKIEKQLNCRLVAISLHYFYMATFSWLFVDVLHLYRMLTEIRNIDSGSMKFYYLLAYVIPGIILGLAVGLNAEGYGSSSFCWLSLTDKFIWSFAGPIIASVIINIFMFALAVKASCREKLSVADITHLRIGLFANIVILVLWGIIWVIGLLAVNFNYTALYVINAVLCLALGVFIFFVYIIINSKVHVELKKLWYKCRGHKLDQEDNVAGTRSSAYSRSALAYRNDSCDTGLSRKNVGISAESTTSRSTSKSSGGLYKGEDYLRSTSTSTSDNVQPVKFPKNANLPPPYDPEKLDDPDSMKVCSQREGNDSDSDSEMSEHSLDLASSHSSDDDDDNDGELDWENKLPKNKIIEEARELARKKKEEFLRQQQQQQQQQLQQQPTHHLPQPSSPVIPVAQHQYQNLFENIYSGSISPRYSPQPMHTTSHWPGDPQLSAYTASESEYRSSDQPTLSSNQPDVTLQTPEYRGREFKIAIPRRTDSFLSDSTSSAGLLRSPLGSPCLKHTPREASTSPIQMLNSPLNVPKENIVKVFTHRGSISTDSECSHETCV